MLKLLAEDISGLPIEMVERAAKHWIMTSSYMPKAADIALLVKNILHAEQPKTSAEGARKLAAERNAKLDADPNSISGRWVADMNGSLSIVPKSMLERRQEPRCTPEQAAEIMREFKIPSSSIIGAIARTLGEPRRAPTAAETADLIAEQPRPSDDEIEWRRSLAEQRGKAADHG